MKHFNYGFNEILKDRFPRLMLNELKRYIPNLTINMLERYPQVSGVRALAINNDGILIDDFIFQWNDNKTILNIKNAPSPAATSSLAIADEIIKEIYHS